MSKSALLLSRAIYKINQHIIDFFMEMRLINVLFVFFSCIVLAAYIFIMGRRLLLNSNTLKIIEYIVIFFCMSTWVIFSLIFSYKNSKKLTESMQNNAFPFVSLLLVVFFLPEFLFGNPGASRIIFILSLVIFMFLVFEILIFFQIGNKIIYWTEMRSKYIIYIIFVLHFITSFILIFLRHYHFGSVLGEDTGYYNQIFWSTLHGQFFQGSLTQERYFDPPVYTEFAVHNSPILFLIFPFYSIYPSFYTLLFLRNLALSASIIPLYLIAKEKSSGFVGIVIALAYLLSPNIFYQSLNAFYPIQFISLILPFTFFFFLKEKFVTFLIFLLLSLSVREEIALTTTLFGVYAFFLNRRWQWIIMPVVLSSLWWYLSTEFIMVHSQIYMDDLQGFFDSLGTSHNEILANVFSNPIRFIKFILTKENISYIYELFKPTISIPFFSITSIFVLPTVIMNSIVGIFWKSTMNISMHYSLVASVCLFISLIYGIDSVGKYHKYFLIEKHIFQLAIILLLIPIMLIGMKDATQYGNDKDKTLVIDFFPKYYYGTLKHILVILDKDPAASVAAPNILLPQLSHRQKLYNSQRLWRYKEPWIDYIVLDVNLDKLGMKDLNRGRYEASIASIRGNHRHKLIFTENGFEVYRVDHANGVQKPRLL